MEANGELSWERHRDKHLSTSRHEAQLCQKHERTYKGLMALDALHLASAEKAGADFFCTCDDQLVKKARLLAAAGVKVLSPIEIIGEVEK